jgi:hypothetical protein
MVGDMKLRASRDAHPGDIDKARSKRPTAEVQAEKREKQLLIHKAEQKKLSSLKNAAAIEHRMETAATNLDANHPPPSATTKVLRPRPQARQGPAVIDPGALLFGSRASTNNIQCSSS